MARLGWPNGFVGAGLLVRQGKPTTTTATTNSHLCAPARALAPRSRSTAYSISLCTRLLGQRSKHLPNPHDWQQRVGHTHMSVVCYPASRLGEAIARTCLPSPSPCPIPLPNSQCYLTILVPTSLPSLAPLLMTPRSLIFQFLSSFLQVAPACRAQSLLREEQAAVSSFLAVFLV